MKLFYRICFVLLIGFQLAHAGSLKGGHDGVLTDSAYRLVIKFSAGSLPDIDSAGCMIFRDHSCSAQLATVLHVLDNAAMKRLVPSETHAGTISQSNSFNIKSFCGLMELVGSNTISPTKLRDLAKSLEGLPCVEYCDLVPARRIPPPTVTSDLSSYQQYNKFDNGGDIIGINATAAWAAGVKGTGVHLADVEFNWDFLHEDLQTNMFKGDVVDGDTTFIDHGTAVAGIMVAGDNGFGVTGNCPDISYTGFSEVSGRVGAIAKAAASLSSGDILMLEMQTSGSDGNLCPADYEKAVWDLTDSITKAGIIVVAAAGNGWISLDIPAYADYLARGDNGAIIVGAGNQAGSGRCDFSDYGSRVNLQGWGDYSVVTTGYGGGNWLFDGDVHRGYTSGFAGTSSATPIVASAVALVQSYAKNKYGKTISPLDMRDILVATGTAQSGTDHIGPLPNVGAAMLRVDTLYGGTSVLAKKTFGSGITATPVKGGLQLSLTRESICSIRLVSLSGRTLSRIETGELSAGAHRIGLPNLASGIYVLSVKTGIGNFEKTMMIDK